MNKGLEINVEIGLCTKDMAKENPIKDFEILIEEHKDKWSKQMYDYFKECLNQIKKKEKALEIIKEKKVNPYIDVYCYNNYNHYLDEYEYFNNKLTQEEYDLLKEVLLCQQRN